MTQLLLKKTFAFYRPLLLLLLLLLLLFYVQINIHHLIKEIVLDTKSLVIV